LTPCSGPDVEDVAGECKIKASSVDAAVADAKTLWEAEALAEDAATPAKTTGLPTINGLSVFGPRPIVWATVISDHEIYTRATSLFENAEPAVTKPVTKGSVLSFVGFGLEQLHPMANFLDVGLLQCKFAFDDNTTDVSTLTTVDTQGMVSGRCTTPARAVAAVTVAEVSILYKGVVIPFVGGSAAVQLLPTVVYEIAPDTGAMATGTAAPFITGVGFDADVQYVCVWTTTTTGDSAKTNAVFINDAALRCGRPPAAFAGLLDANPDLEVNIRLEDASASLVLGGRHDDHTFKYSSGACGDGHQNGGELGVDCGMAACGTYCDATAFAGTGELCDQDSDCKMKGHGCLGSVRYLFLFAATTTGALGSTRLPEA
jgi:hypothetical protein